MGAKRTSRPLAEQILARLDRLELALAPAVLLLRANLVAPAPGLWATSGENAHVWNVDAPEFVPTSAPFAYTDELMGTEVFSQKNECILQVAFPMDSEARSGFAFNSLNKCNPHVVNPLDSEVQCDHLSMQMDEGIPQVENPVGAQVQCAHTVIKMTEGISRASVVPCSSAARERIDIKQYKKKCSCMARCFESWREFVYEHGCEDYTYPTEGISSCCICQNILSEDWSPGRDMDLEQLRVCHGADFDARGVYGGWICGCCLDTVYEHFPDGPQNPIGCVGESEDSDGEEST